MTSGSAHPNELGEFLRARRAELTPSDVGLPETSAIRRVPGLRREEVAQLASISTDYYTRLEQGRIAASDPVLGAVSRVLRLNPDQCAYMHTLAGKQKAKPRRRSGQKVNPALLRVLEGLTEIPAVIFGRRMDVLAWNRMAAALFLDFGEVPTGQRNYIRLVFTHPRMREAYQDWETAARKCLAHLRMEAATRPDDPELAALVGELSVHDERFRKWWAEYHVEIKDFGTKVVVHPLVGEVTVDWETMAPASDGDQQLIFWTAEPGSPSHDALRFLASWSPDSEDERETGRADRSA